MKEKMGKKGILGDLNSAIKKQKAAEGDIETSESEDLDEEETKEKLAKEYSNDMKAKMKNEIKMACLNALSSNCEVHAKEIFKKVELNPEKLV